MNMASLPVNRKRRNSTLGRKGDPRMKRALEARESDPQMPLVEALLIGGFVFPRLDTAENSKNVEDTEGVTLYQRKNQLLRRLRKMRQRCDKTAKSNSTENSTSFDVLSKKRTPQALEPSEILDQKRAHDAQTSVPDEVKSSEAEEKGAKKISAVVKSSEKLESRKMGTLTATSQGDSTTATSNNVEQLSSVVSSSAQSSRSKVNVSPQNEESESESSSFGEIKVEDISLEEMVYPEDEVREHDLLSDTERTEIVNDLYGSTDNSNPFLTAMSEALRAFDEVLNRVDASKKLALVQAQSKCPGLVGKKEKEMFLRWADFDAKQAVTRLIVYWNMRHHLFGENAFFPLTFDRLGEKDKVTYQAGIWKILPQRDEHGRAIIWDDPSRRDPAIHKADSEARCLWYIVHNALEDVSVQEKGFVFLADLRNVKILKNFDRNTHKMFWGSLNEWIPLNIRAVHFIRPPPFADVLLPVIKFLMGRRLRQRMRFHSGTNVDVLRSLSSYGIPESILPIERELI